MSFDETVVWPAVIVISSYCGGDDGSGDGNSAGLDGSVGLSDLLADRAFGAGLPLSMSPKDEFWLDEDEDGDESVGESSCLLSM